MFLQFLLGMALLVALSLVIGKWLMRKAMQGKETGPQAQPEVDPHAPQVLPSSGEPPPTQPIVLKLAGQTWRGHASWCLGLLFGTLCLFSDPSLLWSRWLAYPAAGIMLLLAIIAGACAYSSVRQRVIASADGVELRNGDAVEKRLRWAQVARVSITEHWGSRSKHGSSFSRETYLSKRKLIFADRQGDALLELDVPLTPAASYRQWLDAIPAWAGVPVLMERIDM